MQTATRWWILRMRRKSNCAHDWLMETQTARDAMLAGLSLTSRRIEIGGLTTSVLEAGDGPPLVLLHGGIECGGVMWAPVLAKLAERNRVVVPDLPGLGESSAAPRIDLDTFNAWLTRLLEEMRLDRPSLV